MTRIEVPNSGARRGSRGRVGRWFMVLVVLIVLGGASWTWLTLNWAYAEGERAGVLQKFVRRGWVCKTQEGEIALYYGGGQFLGGGTSPQLWDFSARDKVVADSLSQAVGHRVQLHYTEHPGIPTTCFGETRYFVDRVTVTDGEPVKPLSGGSMGLPGPAVPSSQAPANDSSTGGTLPAPPPPASAAPGNNP